jgi:hypothetical protein
MRHRAPIFGVAVGMTALAWAVREQLVISLVVVCMAIFVAIAAALEKPDPDSADGLRKRLRRAAKLARTVPWPEFYDDHYSDVIGALTIVETKFGIRTNINTLPDRRNPEQSRETMEKLASRFESMAKQI